MEELIQAIRNKNIVLFIGAGVSAGLGVPTWGELIKLIAEKLDYDSEVFNLRGDYLTLAEYYQLKNDGNIDELIKWMKSEWNDNKNISIDSSEIHKLICDLDISTIYTTNYDWWIEKAYEYWNKEYSKISTVKDLVNLDCNKTQIIKFHGDLETEIERITNDKERKTETSIVLTESSYFERLEFEDALDIKLRSDLLGKSVLFIGYSLNDINLRLLLYKLKKLWDRSNSKDDKPQSYIFLGQPNEVQEKILEHRGVKTFVSQVDNPKEGLMKFLEEIKDNLKK